MVLAFFKICFDQLRSIMKAQTLERVIIEQMCLCNRLNKNSKTTNCLIHVDDDLSLSFEITRNLQNLQNNLNKKNNFLTGFSTIYL